MTTAPENKMDVVDRTCRDYMAARADYYAAYKAYGYALCDPSASRTDEISLLDEANRLDRVLCLAERAFADAGATYATDKDRIAQIRNSNRQRDLEVEERNLRLRALRRV